jgi:preprotein translocase subunit Sss1
MKRGIEEMRLSPEHQEALLSTLNTWRKVVLGRKPHIKEYSKIRKMHSEIVSAMVGYYDDEKFQKHFGDDFVPQVELEKLEHMIECDFDLDAEVGKQSFYDMWIYKSAANATCITGEFIRDNRFRKPEKIEFLHSMLDSKLGLFEVTGTDMDEGYVYFKDVFTGTEYKIVDVAASGNRNNNDYYLYTRIISYHGINFSTGLSIMFAKNDSFIMDHIQRQKKDFDPDGEFLRFIHLYKGYSQNPNRVKVFINQY